MNIKNIKGKIILTIDTDTLYGANLYGADLRDADLCGANLRDADLHGANLRDADLRDADLCGADLRNADLCGADLRDADLCSVDLYGVNLYGADLCGANLRDADIENVLYDEYTAFFALVPPEVGAFVAWKKVGNYMIKLQIPDDAKRSSATTRKCRCSKAMVLGIYDKDKNLLGLDRVDNENYAHTEYIVGKMVYPDSWDNDRWNSCSHGIHFFMTFDEAKNY